MLAMRMVIVLFIIFNFISIFTLGRWNRRKGVEHFMTYHGKDIKVKNIHSHTNDEINISNINTGKSLNLQPSYMNPKPSFSIYDSDSKTTNKLLSYQTNPTSGKNEVHLGTKEQTLTLKSNNVTFDKPVEVHKDVTFNNVQFNDKVNFNEDVNMSNSITPKICFDNTQDENCVTEDDIKTILFYDSYKNQYVSIDEDFKYSINLLRGLYIPVDKNEEECDATRTSDITANGKIVDENEMIEKISGWVTGTSSDK